MRLALLSYGFASFLILVGCEPSCQKRFPLGAKLYDAKGQYFGTIVGYDEQHDFRNGMGINPAILIELSGAERTREWASCATSSSFTVKAK